MLPLALVVQVFLWPVLASPAAVVASRGNARNANGNWQKGTVMSFRDSGDFVGMVCVDILQPYPSCGWRAEIFFHFPVVDVPRVVPAEAIFPSALSQQMDWFEFTNKIHNGNLNSTANALTSSCLDLRVEAVTTHPQSTPKFEARMVCACYVLSTA